MEISDSILDRYEKRDNAPKHQKAASVNAIIELLGNDKVYNYTYWLHKIGNASYSDILAIVKEASKLEKKYSKGGFITNSLKKYAVPRTNTKGPRANGRGAQLPQSRRKVQSEVVRKVDDTKEGLEPHEGG